MAVQLFVIPVRRGILPVMNTQKAYHPKFWFTGLLSLVLTALLVALPVARAQAAQPQAAQQPVSSEITVILNLKDTSGLPLQPTTKLNKQGQPDQAAFALENARYHQSLVEALQLNASNSQPALLSRLETLRSQGKVGKVRSFWIANAIAVTLPADQVAALAALPGVESIQPDYALKPVGTIHQSNTLANPVPNMTQIQANWLWSKGYQGQGIVVANVDTGVSLNNMDLAAKWRGGTNSWFDTHGQYTAPVDHDGHGTATMGVMISTNYGVAPAAKWIAVKMFDDQVNASDSDALAAFQWLLDPDGDPKTNDAPNVVNNSWAENSPGCTYSSSTPAMHAALQALLAAKILPVFAAGNLGPGSSTAPDPSNYPEALAVGAVDYSNQIASFSSQGPTTCRPTGQVFPDISAPGVSIQTSPLDDTHGAIYTTASGTSFSAPHAAGMLALLLQAYPGLTADQQRRALQVGAIDLGTPGPDNVFGYGVINGETSYYAAFYLTGGKGPNRMMMPIAGH
jgi:subtilisin family serine protease